MKKTDREQGRIITVEDFDRKYFPEYFQRKQKEKDFEDSEKKDGHVLIQALFSVR